MATRFPPATSSLHPSTAVAAHANGHGHNHGLSGNASAPNAPQYQAESCRLYDTSAILDFVSSTPNLAHLRPQAHEEHAAAQHYLRLADNALTPHIAAWLYASIGIIPFVQHEVETARQSVIQVLATLESTLAHQPTLLSSRFSLADVAVSIALFPAFKNLLDQDTTRRFPGVTHWFFSCINNAQVQHVYDMLQHGQVTYEPKQEARKRKVTVDDYHIIQVLGKGCMGKVLLVRHKKSSNLYALKSISKSSVIMNKELSHTLAERKILSSIAQIQHPFLIQCHNAFTSESELFLVLDFVAGGDIATQLAKFGRFQLQRTRFYAAEIVLGVLELHRLGVVYRDLKPENILLQPDGHILLTDFGLSKMFRPSKDGSSNSNARTNTFAGTAEYLAPEILRNEEYGFEVDWWSFGTLVYEMLVGMTPFWADNHSVMYQRVLEDPLEFPADMASDARAFLSGLLERDPMRRLGHGATAARDIQGHVFFKGVNWEDVYYKRVEAPYVPKVRNALDLSNFEECFTQMSPKLSPPSHDLSASLQAVFMGYSWAPGAPIGSLSRSFMPATPLASSFYGSSAMSLASSLGGPKSEYPPFVDPATNKSSRPSSVDFGGTDFMMDLDDHPASSAAAAARHPGSHAHHHHGHHHEHDDDELDLDDLTPSSASTSPAPSTNSAAAAIAQLTFNARVKKPPVTPAASPSPNPVNPFGGDASPRPSPWVLAPTSSVGMVAAPAAAGGSTLSSPTPSRPGTPNGPLVTPAAGGGSVFTQRSPSPARRGSASSSGTQRLQRSNSGMGSSYWQMFSSSRS
ncbi:kinase-like domain-containing protein [Catenaria anguillulae PL171]|uniref:Kinase-like domain-containing protein n=1 Tax=Catenaria anguillulae PL171 TaxID=765915 RepID=A0A1Y2H8P6_9FUNG|nr:kinase-like domain-containing protein [Catenaria anguillulae PL171]